MTTYTVPLNPVSVRDALDRVKAGYVVLENGRKYQTIVSARVAGVSHGGTR